MLQVPVGEEETEMDKETEDPNKNKEFYCLFLCLSIYFFPFLCDFNQVI